MSDNNPAESQVDPLYKHCTGTVEDNVSASEIDGFIADYYNEDGTCTPPKAGDTNKQSDNSTKPRKDDLERGQNFIKTQKEVILNQLENFDVGFNLEVKKLKENGHKYSNETICREAARSNMYLLNDEISSLDFNGGLDKNFDKYMGIIQKHGSNIKSNESCNLEPLGNISPLDSPTAIESDINAKKMEIF